MAMQIQVPHDRVLQPMDDVRAGRDMEARKDLLGRAGATDDVPPLEHEDIEASPGEVGRGDEAVVPAADDDRIVGRLIHRPRSSRSARVASYLLGSGSSIVGDDSDRIT